MRFIGAGQFEHPIHLHGMPFTIVATDGYPAPEVAQLTKDVISVHPGERFDVEFVADNLGQWVFHCHIVHHTADGKTAYATNGGDDTVTAIDVATMKAIASIPVGAYSHGLRPSPDGKWIYVANTKGTTLSA